MSAAEPLIRLTAVKKDYVSAAGVVHALADVDIRIMPGEFVAVIGTSGSGKSTLMNILGCLDRPSSGTYELAGIDVGARTSDGRAIVRNRLIGFIFQGFNLLSRTTALENVELPLSYRGVPAKERRKRSEQVLTAVGLEGRMDHTPNQLSGGQQQRVAIARALVTDPPLLLADEPTGNLDTRTSLEVLSLLQRLNRERGITICLVTHENDIAACASRVITFRDGRIVSDIRREPEDAAAALAVLGKEVKTAGPAMSETGAGRDGFVLSRTVPWGLYFVMLFGMLGGAGLGALYNSVVLGFSVVWIPAVMALLLESLLASGFARKHFGRAFTHDERSRVAWYWSLATVGISAIITLAIMPTFARNLLLPASIAQYTKIAGGILGAIVLLALLRYCVLWAFERLRTSLQTPKRQAS
jgi:putative ABC transport system ATP-binding protein